jgi:hypothetical protein
MRTTDFRDEARIDHRNELNSILRTAITVAETAESFVVDA